MISFAKKFLSIALALVLLVGVFPAAVSAAGHTVTLDVRGAEFKVPVDADNKLDLSSTEYVLAQQAAQAIVIDEGFVNHIWVYHKDQKPVDVFEDQFNGPNYRLDVKFLGGDEGDPQPQPQPQPQPNVEYRVNVYQNGAATGKAVTTVNGYMLKADVDACLTYDKTVNYNIRYTFLKDRNAANAQDPFTFKIDSNNYNVNVELTPVVKPQPVGQHNVRVYNEKGVLVDTLKVTHGEYINMVELDKHIPQDVLNATFVEWEFGNGDRNVAATQIIADRDVHPVMVEGTTTHTVTIRNANGVVKSIPVIHNARIPSSDLNAMETTYHKTWKFTQPAALAGEDVASTLIKQDCTVVEVETDKGTIVEYDVIFLEKLSDGNVVQKAKGRIQNGHVMGEMFPKLNNKLPQPVRQGYVFDDWVLCDAYGNILEPEQAFRWNTVFNEGRSIYLVATWTKEAPVYLHIYVNGNTKTEYETHLIENLRVGDSIDVSKIDVLDHYNNGNSRNKNLKVDGIFNMALWRDYRLDGKARPLTGFIPVEGSTNNSDLYAMVWDPAVKNNSKPDTTNPKTGDETMIFATTAVMLVSAGALAVFFMDRKRRNG